MEEAGDRQGDDDRHLEQAEDDERPHRQLDPAVGNDRDQACAADDPGPPRNVDAVLGLERRVQHRPEIREHEARQDRRVERVHPRGEEAGARAERAGRVGVVAAGGREPFRELGGGEREHERDPERGDERQRDGGAREEHEELEREQERDRGREMRRGLEEDAGEANCAFPEGARAASRTLR